MNKELTEESSETVEVSNVLKVIQDRFSCRAFLKEDIPLGVVIGLLLQARLAPSGGNLQPWKCYVLIGEDKSRFEDFIQKKIQEGNLFKEEPEYQVYPPDLKDPYKRRRFECGRDL